MSEKSLDVRVVRAVMRTLGPQFRTKELSDHPDMRRAHAELVGQRNYHAWVGKCLSQDITEAQPIGPSNGKSGVLWRNSLSAAKEPGAQRTGARSDGVE